MAPATRNKAFPRSIGTKDGTESLPIAQRPGPSGTKRQRDPADSDARIGQRQRTNAMQTIIYHRENPSDISHHRRQHPPAIVDLTKGDDDDNDGINRGNRHGIIQYHGNTPRIKTELLSTDGTDSIVITRVEDTEPVARDELVGSNGVEQQTSSRGLDPHSASLEAVVGVSCDNLQANTKQSAPESSPAAAFRIQQISVRTHTTEKSLDEVEEESAQRIEGLFKNDLEEARTNVEESKERLKQLKEDLDNERTKLAFHESLFQHYRNLISSAKPGGARNKAKVRGRKLLSIGQTATGSPASVQQPTGTASTAATSLITRNSQQSPVITHRTATVDKNMLSATGPTTLQSGATTDTVIRAIGSPNIDAAGNGSQMLAYHSNSLPSQGTHAPSECTRSWERITQTEYTGQVISTHELETRERKKDGYGIIEGHFNFEVKPRRRSEHLWLDSTYKGSIARFANHHCEPNCKVVEFLDGHGPRLFLESVRRINPGDAITISYGQIVPPAYFRVLIGLIYHDVPVCYCGKEICQWQLKPAVLDMKTWLEKVPVVWLKDRKSGESVPRTMDLYLPGVRRTINILDENCNPGNEEEALRIACGRMITELEALLAPIMGKNGS
ncbi:histone-lysine n H3 lysine-36 specific [Fusarium globosum]|uniref:Histone-lysine n H3 lysine-36 specific n=1 Tax=Fusarium globosum TaxID=78864 RepID=A0A8H5Y6C3_9HYPO|nr:histone-lysine n H3 lysine-36 specific [Fusarium globosum]